MENSGEEDLKEGVWENKNEFQGALHAGETIMWKCLGRWELREHLGVDISKPKSGTFKWPIYSYGFPFKSQLSSLENVQNFT